jgi:hypothetical protein
LKQQNFQQFKIKNINLMFFKIFIEPLGMSVMQIEQTRIDVFASNENQNCIEKN